METPVLQEALKLTVAQRLELIEALWDSVAESGESVAVPEAHVAELERRLADIQSNPHGDVPWEQVREELRRRP